ncbi:MAG: molybdopterin-dependent oxidoreductase [Verrucomicrobia subdivision 3 bacterium]|nr:molybdopterin-dependent oxidoreductase [Limisphaerales bacterium]
MKIAARHPVSKGRLSRSRLRELTGPLTAELVQEPGEFGLGRVPARLKPDSTTNLVCGFCSTGCGLTAHLRNGQAVNLSAAVEYPVNRGLACPKGWEALTPLSAADRATTPLLRNPFSGAMDAIGWEHALQVFTARFKRLMDQHGPESVGVLSTGQICTEEMAFLGALFKFGMGGLHCDSNTRQCMATSHVAYKQSFGFDAPPYAYADFEESDVLVFVGSNLCVAHPIMWQRVLRNPHRPEIIVVDPRKTETAMAATQHLAIKPRSDLVLLYGVANALTARGSVKREFVDKHTSGFEEFAAFVREFTPETVCAATGLNRAEFERFVASISGGARVSFWWTMGVNQGHESTRTAQALINLALMTGNIGRPGTGANSITGQCNAMGSRLFANATSLLGGRDFLNAKHRVEVAEILDIPLRRIPNRNSLAYDQIVERVRDGRMKGLWVIATNPSHSWIDHNALNEALDKLDFLVVQDLYTTTETARHADLLLPAAGWGEKEGTFINSERRLGLVKKVSRAPGQALADFHIFRLVAHYWGCGDLFREWTSPQAAFQILKRLSVGQPCDFSGIENYSHLDRSGGIQWPFAASHADTPEAAANERRLFADGRFYHSDGKARFIFEAPRPAVEQPDSEYPFALLTGRGSSAQWHTLTRTNKSEILRRLGPSELQIEIHPSDARDLGLRAGGRAHVVSRRGSLVATTLITATIQRGHVFLPMHDASTNGLTLAVFDPYSRQPGYKFCAVRLEPLKKHDGRT